MAQLTVTFNPIPGVVSYNICYTPSSGGTTLCVEETTSPVIITAGIVCGVSYNVSVTSNCSLEDFTTAQSTPVTTTALAIECPPPPAQCLSYTVSTTSGQGQTSTYTDCDGNGQSVTIGGVSGYDSSTFCAQEGTVNPGVECTLTTNGACGTPPSGKNINVTGVYGSMEPCIGGTIDDFMSASVTLDDTVTVDTNVNVNVYYTDLHGGSCASPNTQGFTVFIPAGQNSGAVIACQQGAYFAQGAYICSAQVTGTDNTVDTIHF